MAGEFDITVGVYNRDCVINGLLFRAEMIYNNKNGIWGSDG